MIFTFIPRILFLLCFWISVRSTVNVCINTCILTVHQCCLQGLQFVSVYTFSPHCCSVELCQSDGKTSANLCVHSVPGDVSQVIIALLVNKVKCKTGNRNPDTNFILAYSYLCADYDIANIVLSLPPCIQNWNAHTLFSFCVHNGSQIKN